MTERVIHTIDPWYDINSTTLLLGSFPSPLSRKYGFPYGNPQNRFWKVIAHVFCAPVPETVEERKSLILDNNLALWDVIKSCTIEGASDASIEDVVPNDLSFLLDHAQIRRIFTTGSKAHELYKKYLEHETGIQAIKLPSTSSANARYSLDDLVQVYNVLNE